MCWDLKVVDNLLVFTPGGPISTNWQAFHELGSALATPTFGYCQGGRRRLHRYLGRLCPRIHHTPLDLCLDCTWVRKFLGLKN